MHPLRTLLLLFALGTLAVPNAHAQQPFEVVPPTGKPWTLVFTSGTINQNPLPNGAWIGVFDGAQAVGAAEFTGTFPLSVTAWQSDPGTGLAGFTPGNPISVRIHTAYFDTTLTLDATVTWASGRGAFGEGAFAAGGMAATSNRVPVAELDEITVLDFGRVPIGQTSERSVEIRNSGRARLRVLDVHSSSVYQPQQRQFDLAPGQSATLRVTFAPNAAAPFPATLTLQTDDPVQPNRSLTLTGQGLPVRSASFELETASLDFGWIPVDSLAVREVRVRSTGTDTLRLTSLNMQGDGFAVTASRTVIPPGQSATLRLTFQPRQATSSGATLNLFTNAGSGIVYVSGTGYQPFYGLPVSTGLPYAVVFSNLRVDRLPLQTGDEVALWAGDRIVGAAVFTGAMPFTVTAWQQQAAPALSGFAPGDSIRIRVRTERFGARTDVALDSLTFTQGNGRFGTGAFAVVDARGYSGRAPRLEVNASEMAFGAVPANATATRSVRVRNPGQTALSLSLSVDSPFAVVGASSRTVPPLDSIEVQVQFSPSAIGTWAGILQLTSNDPFQGPVNVPVSARSTIVVAGSPVQFEMEPLPILSVSTEAPVGFEVRLFNPFAQDAVGTLALRSTTGRVSVSAEAFDVALQPVSRFQEQIRVTGLEVGRDTLEVIFRTPSRQEVVFRQPLWVHASLFAPVAPSGRPFTVVVSGIQTQGLPLAFGDEVALLDGSLVVGTGLYTGPNDPVVVTAWEEDASQGVQGFRRGQPMTFRIAKRARGYEERLALHTRGVTFSGTGRFGEGAFQQATLTVDEPPFWLNRLQSDRVRMNAFTNRVWARLDTVVVDPDLGSITYTVRTDTSGLRASITNNRILFDLTPNFHGFVQVHLTATQGPYVLRDSFQVHIVKPPRLVVDDLFRAPFVWEDRQVRALQWDAERALEPPHYVLEYSANNGVRWDTLYVGTESSFDWAPPVQTFNENNRFRLTVTDLMGNRDVVQSAVPFTIASPRQSRQWAAGWHLAGAPFQAVDHDRSEPARGLRYRWTGSDYEAVQTYSPMEAHWLGLAFPRSDSLIGTVAEQPTRVRLAQGWHPVTSGLLRTVYADSIRIHRTGQAPISLSAAVAQGLVVAPVEYRAETYHAAADLAPFGGYWIGVQHPEGVEVEFPIHRYRTMGEGVQEGEQKPMLAFELIAGDYTHTLMLGGPPVLVPPPAPHGNRAGWVGPETALGSLYLSRSMPAEEDAVEVHVHPAQGTARLSWTGTLATDTPLHLYLPDGTSFDLSTPGSAAWDLEHGMPTVRAVGAPTSAHEAVLPTELALGQAFPNPSNGSAIIAYALPHSTDLKLEVFSLLGQRVMVVVEGLQPAGFHQARIDAQSLPSGMYVYRLTTPDRVLQGTFLRVE